MKLLTNIRIVTEEDCGLVIPSKHVAKVEYYVRIIEAAVMAGWTDVDLDSLKAEIDYLLSLPEDTPLPDLEDLSIVKDEAISWMNYSVRRGFQFADTAKGLVLIRYLALQQEESYDEPKL
jgi:hypothetical protein